MEENREPIEEVDAPSPFEEIMEMVCDNCLTHYLTSHDEEWDPEADPCESCLIEAAVQDGLSEAQREGVTIACQKMLDYLHQEKVRAVRGHP